MIVLAMFSFILSAILLAAVFQGDKDVVGASLINAAGLFFLAGCVLLK
jgi:hypothetical protein